MATHSFQENSKSNVLFTPFLLITRCHVPKVDRLAQECAQPPKESPPEPISRNDFISHCPQPALAFAAPLRFHALSSLSFHFLLHLPPHHPHRPPSGPDPFCQNFPDNVAFQLSNPLNMVKMRPTCSADLHPTVTLPKLAPPSCPELSSTSPEVITRLFYTLLSSSQLPL